MKEFSELIQFVESLRELDQLTWITPLAEGKWTLRDVVAHIMLWDKYFLEEGIQKITNNQPVTVQHLNFDQFNQKAVDYAKRTSRQEIIDRTIQYRSELINQIQSLSEEAFIEERVDGDGNKFSAYQYLLDFIWHDHHHINQLKTFLSKREA